MQDGDNDVTHTFAKRWLIRRVSKFDSPITPVRVSPIWKHLSMQHGPASQLLAILSIAGG